MDVNNAGFKMFKVVFANVMKEMHLTHLLDLEGTHCILASNTQCKHYFCLFMRKLHMAPLNDQHLLDVAVNKPKAVQFFYEHFSQVIIVWEKSANRTETFIASVRLSRPTVPKGELPEVSQNRVKVSGTIKGAKEVSR